MSGDFRIRADYVPRLTPGYATDDLVSGFQPHVYDLARSLARLLGVRTVIDIGCGAAGKLVEFSPEFKVVGMDYGPNLAAAQERCPAGKWIEVDLENFSPEIISAEDSVLICADVIEHLVEPASLVKALGTWLEVAPLALLSTPERVLCWGADHAGPPPNPTHVREWTRVELVEYLRRSGLRVAFAGVTQTHADHPETGAHQGCQTTIVICEGRPR